MDFSSMSVPWPSAFLSFQTAEYVVGLLFLQAPNSVQSRLQFYGTTVRHRIACSEADPLVLWLSNLARVATDNRAKALSDIFAASAHKRHWGRRRRAIQAITIAKSPWHQRNAQEVAFRESSPASHP